MRDGHFLEQQLREGDPLWMTPTKHVFSYLNDEITNLRLFVPQSVT